ncbi:MAG: phosphotransferase [Steroidobacteraceae bacterium]|nr:phosphotransferase [Steroidobacteraceae bacterium]
MAATDDIRKLIPHGGSMCLLERIVGSDERGMTLATGTHALPTNPLRRHGRLHAIHLCEYGAQAMAAHGGLFARTAGETAMPGLLVSLRDVVLSADYIEALAGELLVVVERLQAGAAGLQYAFRVTHRDVELARGRAAVILGVGPVSGSVEQH